MKSSEFDPFLLISLVPAPGCGIKKAIIFGVRFPPEKKKAFPFHTQNDIPAENILFHIYIPPCCIHIY